MAKKTPYPHQRKAVTAIIKSWRDSKIPVASCATGFGKSFVAAILAEKALQQGKRALILVPSKELCEQNYKEFFEWTDNKSAIGICCSKLAKFQTTRPAVVATWTSFLNRRATSGSFDLVIIDEAHLVSPDADSTLQKILRSLYRLNPSLKLCGLTGTPYRAHGMIHEDSVKGKATFNHLCYESDIVQLIHDGFLSRVELINNAVSVDLSGVSIVRGDYDTTKAGVKFAEILPDAVADMRAKFEQHNITTAIIFASNIANAELVLEQWSDKSTMRIVHGKMLDAHRKAAIHWIKEGQEGTQRYIVNVGVLTTGFDYKLLECVVLLRATTSKGLYIQMVGRVIRSHDEKECGYLIDYGSNVDRHGSIDGVIPPKTVKKVGDAPTKLCLECETVNNAGAKKCKECGAEFISDPNAEGKYSMRTKAQILRDSWQTVDVDSMMFGVAISKSGFNILKIGYYDEDSELIATQLLCLNHDGVAKVIAQQKLLQFLKEHKYFYMMAAENMLNSESIAELMSVQYNDYFKKVVSVTVGAQGGEGKYRNQLEVKKINFEIA